MSTDLSAGSASTGRWWRGDCHVHSVLSGGELTPRELVRAAQASGLDFIAATEHNAPADESWLAECGDYPVIFGQEVVAADGHWLASGLASGTAANWRYSAGDHLITQEIDRVRRDGGICVVAHPFAPYPTGRFEFDQSDFDAVEVWNGLWSSEQAWNADNEAALAQWGRSLVHDIGRGRWRVAVGNSDTHLIGQIGTPQTVVWAKHSGSDAILAGLRAGRCWIASSADVEMTLQAVAGGRAAGIGQQLDASGELVEVEVRVRGVMSGSITLVTDRGPVQSARLPNSGMGVTCWSVPSGQARFVRVEVRHASGQMAALTNPIVIT